MSQNFEILKPEEQLKITNSNVTVVGAGGLGCSVLLQLTLLGLGTINIIDDDKIEPHNLHRQVLYNKNDIDSLKVNVAVRKLKEFNENVIFTACSKRLTSSNSVEILSNTDIIIDCTDNLTARIVIDHYCAKNDIPMIYGGVKGNGGVVSVFNFNKGKSFKETFINYKESIEDESCNNSRVLVTIVSTLAGLQVNQVMKILLNQNGILQNKLQVFNLLNNEFKIFSLK